MGSEERSASTASTPVTLFTRSKLSFLRIMRPVTQNYHSLQFAAIPEAEDGGGQEREHLHRVVRKDEVPEVEQLAGREVAREATHNPPSILE